MVSTVTNNLNYLAGTSFSEVGRTGAIKNGKPTEALDALKRITPDLAGQQVEQVGNELQQDGRDSQGRFGTFDERQPSLSDYVRPKVALAPSDEVALFAVDGTAASEQDGVAQPQVQADQASFLKGKEDQAQQHLQDQISRRKQYYVAQLYAQTSDITFSGDSFVNQAA